MKKLKKNFNIKIIILVLLLVINFTLISVSFANFIMWFVNFKKTKNTENKIAEVVDIVDVINEENVEIVETNDNKSSPYWDYIKTNLINVDFEELTKINSSTVGWLQVNGTNINYPFVQTDNNDFYLKHSFDKTYNESGWLFLDFRNNFLDDKNSIIYGHSMNNKTMFGSLKNILNSDWLNNVNNHVIKVSTEKENTLWQVFSIYHIATTTDYLQTEFVSDKTYLDFLHILKNRSSFVFNTTITETTRILTLSTCYNDSEKIVMHAKLIKKETK